jgi:PKD repeat protein
MKFALPLLRLGRPLLLGLAAWAGSQQAANAQAQPTAELLRARHQAVNKVKIKTKTVAQAGANPRLDSELQRLAAQAASASAVELRAGFPHLHFSQQASQPTVLVRITAKDVTALLPLLQRRGFEAVSSYPKLHFVEGMLPVSQLAATTALSSNGLLGISASIVPEVDGGIVTSQADYVLEAARARATRPRQITGAGVTIGALSDSYNFLGGAAADVASGDLPAGGVRVLSDAGSSDEGRAMCQLIYDLAPGSPQVFSTANGGEGVFAQHIRDLANPTLGNCKVIVDDVRYFEEPYFQDGVVAQAVTDVVTNQGVAYFASNGNYADKSYETTAPQFVANANGARCLNFDVSGATTDLTQRVTIPNGGTFYPVLQWSDPFYTTNGVRTDLDLFLLAVRSTGVVDTLFRSNSRNLLLQRPLESIFFSNSTATTGTTTFDLVIVWKAGILPARLKYVNRGSAVPSEWLTSSSTSYGHSSSGEACGVAAIPYYNQRVPESFTSKAGPITYLFSPTGVALTTPIVRQKPDISCIDGTNTTFFGSDYENDGFPNFFGTSAAAPHAAAVAALLLASEPTLTPRQVYNRLAGSARLIGTSATDPYTGPGLIDAFTALYGAVVAATPPVAEDLEKGALPVSWNVNGYGAARAQVSTLAPASGVQSLLLDAYPGINSVFSLNEAMLFLQGATASNLRLTFRERKFTAETDEAMPTQFTGRSNTDGVAMSVDGGTVWYRIVDLTGTNATTTHQTKSVDLTAFATANSLTLGNDIRIKFQQYGRGGATAPVAANRTGRAFDDIVVGSLVPPPAPLYTYSQSAGCPGLQVQFADSSLFRPTAWAWAFAGGTPTTSTLPNPIVTYNTPGRHSVTLSVTNAAGTVARTDTGVVVINGRAPLPTITNTSLIICAGENVTFGSTALNCPSTYSWTFPGGTPATSTAQNPGVVTYATAGNYTATLTVANAFGSTPVSVVVAVGGRAPVPTITSTNPSICRGGTVSFTSSVLYCTDTYSWSFPGGTPATSTAPNPRVTYATAGNYTATLTVTNAFGNNTTSIIVDVDGRVATPFSETFNAATTLPRGWTLVTTTPAYPWAVVSGIVGRTGTVSNVLRAPFADDPNRSELLSVYSPALNLNYASANRPTLRFDLAYRPYASVAGAQTVDNDSLIVQIANACTGAVIGRPYAKSALTNLPTGASLPTFVPTASDWRQEIVDLTPYIGSSIVIRFVGRNQYGNNLFIDNVQVNEGLLSMTSAANVVGFEAWPNPTPSGAALNLRLPAFSGKVSLRLVDALGRVVWQEQVQQSGAALERTLHPSVAAGIYALLYVPAGGTGAARRIVLE